MVYAAFAVGVSVYLIFWLAPAYGQSNILVYIAICSLIGSLSVMGCKGLSIAIILTVEGTSQLQNPLSWFFLFAVAVCIAIQMNYLNKSLDIFNTSIVTPIYYVMFTTLTITASAILFHEWKSLTTVNVIGALCGFATIICGVFLLHSFKDIHYTLNDLLKLTSRTNGANGSGIEIVEGCETDVAARQAEQTVSISSPLSPSFERNHLLLETQVGHSSVALLHEGEDETEMDASESDKFIP